MSYFINLPFLPQEIVGIHSPTHLSKGVKKDLMNNTKPYYAVIFTSTMTDNTEGYSEMAQKMEDLAQKQPGYIDVESARGDIGITISYWESLEAISNWKANADHLFAQQKGIKNWYARYKVRICLVEREYEASPNPS